jgi:hypothetical protein
MQTYVCIALALRMKVAAEEEQQEEERDLLTRNI